MFCFMRIMYCEESSQLMDIAIKGSILILSVFSLLTIYSLLLLQQLVRSNIVSYMYNTRSPNSIRIHELFALIVLMLIMKHGVNIVIC